MNLLVNTLHGMPNIKKAGNLESSLKSNVKIVIPSGTELLNVIGDMVGVRPLNTKSENKYQKTA